MFDTYSDALALESPELDALELQLLRAQPSTPEEAGAILAIAATYLHPDVEEDCRTLAVDAVKRCAAFLKAPVAIAEWHGCR